MAFELTGTIIDVFPAQTFNKGFRKREYVVETGDRYPQKIIFTLVQDKCDYLDSYGVGDTVTSAFEVKGREWQDKSGATKYFNSLEVSSMSGQQRSDTKSKAPVDTGDEDDEIFRSLGIDIGPKKASTEYTKSTEKDDDLPW